MKFKEAISLRDLAGFLGAKYVGKPDHLVEGMNEIHMVEKGDLTFVDHPKYYDKALNSNATTILINKDVPCPEGPCLSLRFSALYGQKLVLFPVSHAETQQ